MKNKLTFRRAGFIALALCAMSAPAFAEETADELQRDALQGASYTVSNSDDASFTATPMSVDSSDPQFQAHTMASWDEGGLAVPLSVGSSSSTSSTSMSDREAAARADERALLGM